MHSPFKEISERIFHTLEEAWGNYQDIELPDVQKILNEIRKELTPPYEQLGMWESIELNSADQALSKGYAQLALSFALNAITVSRLSSDEYTYGLELLRCPSAIPVSEKLMTSSARDHRNALEKARTSSQNKAATVLLTQQKQRADILKKKQNDDAQGLLERNIEAASRLATQGALEISLLSSHEIKRDARQKELEQALSWVAGGYSVLSDTPSGNKCYEMIVRDRIQSAIQLDTFQKAEAQSMRIENEKTAKALVKQEGNDAKRLAKEQKITASKAQEE